MRHNQTTDTGDYTKEQWIEHFWVSRQKEDLESLSYAVNLALQLQPEKLRSKEPCSLHVADVLRSIRVDQQTLIAALISDTSMDIPTDDYDIHGFNHTVLPLVNNVHVLNKMRSCDKEDELGIIKSTEPDQAELIRRMMLGLTEDVRAVLIFLAWRLSQLQDLSYVSVNKRRCIANETLNIFSPLANRLGISQLKWEMEDLSFRYIDPISYKRIAKALDDKRFEREDYILLMTDTLKRLMLSKGIKAKVYGRPKHIYSIYKKMQRKGTDNLDELYDVRAIRIIVEHDDMCYQALDIIHAAWEPIPEEYDNYIARPKPNGYQSLHTVVNGPQGKTVEIQIRTEDMNIFAEMGVAAHWQYKEEGMNNSSMQKAVASIRAVLDQDDSDTQLLENFKTEIFADRVFVFTPKGQIHDLPKGATVLDFAYSVHTELGHKCRGAKVNGRIVPLNYQVSNGDVIGILKSEAAKPSRDWLHSSTTDYVRSAKAKSSIRQWFRQKHDDENKREGKLTLAKQLRLHHVVKPNIEELCKRLHVQNDQSLYLGLGRGDISMRQLGNALNEPNSGHEFKPYLKSRGEAPTSELQVEGESNVMVNIGNCCKPVPGDEIIGYITLGRGVTVHRKSCPNIQLNNLMPDQHTRLTTVNWGGVEKESYYAVDLTIIGDDQPGLLRDIAEVMTKVNTNIQKIESKLDKANNSAMIKVTIQLQGKYALDHIVIKLTDLTNVREVRRAS